MAEQSDISQRIMTLLAEQLHQEIPAKTTDLIDEGLLDSMLFVDLIMGLEHEFGIEITIGDLEIDQFRSVAKISQFVLSGMHASDTDAAELESTVTASESEVVP